MATKSISQLDTQATANETDLFEVAIVDANSASGYASKKETAAAIADAIVGEYQYPLRITGTTAKTIAGAINELKNLITLLPKFAIEVVQTLPVSDISETTLYFVPASDPEQGNYYEEYIYVNNAWELIGTTKVNLSEYYTSAQVDTLLAAKANTSSLAPVATSGAYSDLTGKPTIDTALDTTSTNAVENRAVASEINSIKSDITVEGSASGDIATLVDGSDNPLKELKINIVAQQSGSGDPSPTNVRPITGWTGANITRCRKNFFDKSAIIRAYVDVSGNLVTNNANLALNRFIPVKNGDVITFSSNATIFASGIALYDNNKTFVRRVLTTNDSVCKLTANVDGFILCSFNYNNANHTEEEWATIVDNLQIQLEFANGRTAYESYNGNTYNITWQSEAGTIYGGTLDVKTGELTVTKGKIKVSDITGWTRSNNNGAWDHYIFISNNITYLNLAGPPIEVMCDTFKFTTQDRSVMPDHNITKASNAKFIYIRADECESVTAFKNAYDNVDILIPYATPVTYQLTSTEVRSLLGTNNIFANCGAITELKYIRDLNLCINDIISRIEALEGASSSRSLSVSSVLTKSLTKSLTSDSDKTEGKTEEETEEETKEEAQKNER